MYSGLAFQVSRDGQPEREGECWPLPLRGGSIGRSPECTWVLKDPNRVVSRLHAQITLTDSRCHWTDLGTNHTLVNGKPMPQNQPVPISLGDVLKIGDYSLTLSQSADNWSDCNDLMPQPEVDPLLSLSPTPEVNVSIDELLSAFDPPSKPQGIEFEDAVPVLAQRMYVGSHQDSVQQPAQACAPGPENPDTEKFRHLLGLCVQGCMQLLAARRVFKEETGSRLTSISDKGNNPLKFSATPAEAMTKMLSSDSSAYLDAEQALEQAFQDIQTHMQLSVARIQALIEQVQEQLDPKMIEQEINRQGGLSLNLELARKARLWDLYCQRYRDVSSTWN